MPTSRSSTRVLVAAALLLTTAGCSLFSDDPDDSDQPSSSPSGVTITEAPPDALAGIESALDRRADAVRRGDERRFLAGLAKGDQGDPGLRDEQRTYFANLRQLPLAVFDYSVDPAGLVRDGQDYWVVVALSLQLEGFDTAPFVTRDRFRFTPGAAPGRYRLASENRDFDAASFCEYLAELVNAYPIITIEDGMDEGGLAWDDTNNNRAFLSQTISATNNGASIYIEAKKKPDTYKTEKGTPMFQDIRHAPIPKGAAGQDGQGKTTDQGHAPQALSGPGAGPAQQAHGQGEREYREARTQSVLDNPDPRGATPRDGT